MSSDVVGTLDSLFQQTRLRFVDEILLTGPSEQGQVQDVLEKARKHGIDLRVVPHLYDGLAWNAPLEYIGQFPTIPLHHGYVPEMELFLKRIFDFIFSGMVLLLLSPFSLWYRSPSNWIPTGQFSISQSGLGRRGGSFAASNSGRWCTMQKRSGLLCST